jgi:hypothetical protein
VVAEGSFCLPGASCRLKSDERTRPVGTVKDSEGSLES